MPRVSDRSKPYLSIVRYCETLLEQHGDSHLGVGSRTQENAHIGFRVMLDLITTGTAKVSLLDFGCGLSHLYEYIRAEGLDHIAYSGLDLSPRFLEVSRQKFPHLTYYDIDVLEEPDRLPDFDYIVMNGIFNARLNMSYSDMFDYITNVLRAVFPKTRIGLAFTVMSKYVDWERDDLFHLPFDELATLLDDHLTRNFVIRHDYGRYEYTTYLYRTC